MTRLDVPEDYERASQARRLSQRIELEGEGGRETRVAPGERRRASRKRVRSCSRDWDGYRVPVSSWSVDRLLIAGGPAGEPGWRAPGPALTRPVHYDVRGKDVGRWIQHQTELL